MLLLTQHCSQLFVLGLLLSVCVQSTQDGDPGISETIKS